MIKKLNLFFSHPHLRSLNFSVMDSKFRTLWSHHQNPGLKLHLSIAAENFLKFIKPSPGEVFWSNSSQVGALSADSHLFFVHLFSLGEESFYGAFDFSLFGFRPFPPVPLDLKTPVSSQQETLKQVIGHFSLGVQNLETLTVKIQLFWEQIHQFKEVCLAAEKKNRFFSRREEIFAQQKDSIRQRFKENPVSSTHQQTIIDGTLVKLDLTVSEELLVFDFSETQMRKNWGWPESVTNSICAYFSSQFFPIQDAHHSNFSFLKMIHSRQSPLASKDFCFEKHSKNLHEFFMFLQKSFEAVSHRFILKELVSFGRLSDQEIEFLYNKKSLRLSLQNQNNKSGILEVHHDQKMISMCEFKQLFPEVNIKLDLPYMQLNYPADFVLMGHSENCKVEKSPNQIRWLFQSEAKQSDLKK